MEGLFSSLDRVMEVNDTYTPCRVSEIDNEIDDCSPNNISPSSWPSAIAEEVLADRVNSSGHLWANTSMLLNATIDPTEGMLYNYYEVSYFQSFLTCEKNSESVTQRGSSKDPLILASKKNNLESWSDCSSSAALMHRLRHGFSKLKNLLH